jgi:hypothetical protein
MVSADANVVLFLYNTFWAALSQQDYETSRRVLSVLCTSVKIEDAKFRMRGHGCDL